MEQIVVGNISIDVVRKDIKNIHLAVCRPPAKFVSLRLLL